MKWFLRTMEEHASGRGNLGVQDLIEKFNSQTEFPINPIDEEEWKKIFKEVQPIVFTPPENFLPLEKIEVESPIIEIDAAPFKTFSVEFLHDGNKHDLKTLANTENWYLYCIVVHEIEPNKFAWMILCAPRFYRNTRIEIPVEEMQFFSLDSHTVATLASIIEEKDGGMGRGPKVTGLANDFKEINALVNSSIEYLLKRLNTEKCGTESVRHSVKIGTGKNKYHHRIRRIVYVTPKKNQSLATGTRDIDWTHRWFTRGHWRDVHGLGKDREGNYCISGKTWVTEHEKGPEDKPLIKKVRMVTE